MTKAHGIAISLGCIALSFILIVVASSTEMQLVALWTGIMSAISGIGGVIGFCVSLTEL